MASPSSRLGETRHVPAPPNPVLQDTQSQWIFSDEELSRTPSLLDGMAMETEHTMRSKGVNFIVQVGIMLKLPQLTLATASVYLHRFFMRYSMVDLPQRGGMHPYPVAATSLFLATKVEENCRKMKELVVACCRVAQKQPNLVVDEQSKEFWKWRDIILHNEDLLLEALCFDLQLEQPYRILYDLICFFKGNDNKPLRNAAWAFVNDSTYTVLCLQFSARTIAASALYAAARLCNVAFEDDDFGRPWWEQVDADLTDIRRACNRMAQFYENNSVHKQSQPYPTIPIHIETASETTRIPRRGSAMGTPSEGEANGRKRSRDPEDEIGSCYSSSQLVEQTSSVNGAAFDGHHPEPSPKRQRIVPDSSDTSRLAGPDGGSHHSLPFQGTGDNVALPWNPSANPPPQISLNGYNHIHIDRNQSSQNQRLPFSNHHRQQHPLPPVPPISVPPLPPPPPYQPSRRDSAHGNPEAPDLIQQRIDEIVQKGLSQTHNDKRRADHYRPPREREWDRGRRRSSATSGSAAGGGRRPSLEQRQQPSIPTQDPDPIDRREGDDGGGSEEGEL